jgi:hypothetical protein
MRKNTKNWKRQTSLWAAYIITTFVPWESGKPEISSYDELCDLLEKWFHSENPVLKARYQCIVNVSQGLVASTITKKVISAWRGRERKLWKDNTRYYEFSVKDSEEIDLSDLLPHLNHESDDEDIDFATKKYIESTIQQLHDVLGNEPLENQSFGVENIQCLERERSIRLYEEIKNIEKDFDVKTPATKVCGKPRQKEKEAPSYENCNPSQKKAADRIIQWLTELDTYNLNSNYQSFPDPPLFLCHGGPGTGKSYLIDVLNYIVGTERVLNAAPTGIVAAAMYKGGTFNSLFQIPVPALGQVKDVHLKALNLRQKVKMKNLLEGKILIIMDEVSMMDVIMLSHINQRLQEVLESSHLFGGLSILMCGDFQQLPPTSGCALFRAVLNESLEEGKPSSCGAEIFKKFVKIDLEIQERSSDDTIQTGNVDFLRERGFISKAILSSIPPLSSSDIVADPSWEMAPIIVTSNLERQAINLLKARRFARANGTRVLRWRNNLSNKVASRLPGSVLEKLSEKQEMNFIFIKGAPCYLTKNINPIRGLANGTPGELHSLTFSDSDTAAMVQDLMRKDRSDDIIDIPSPMCVNIRVPHLDGSWEKSMSLEEGAVVIPILIDDKFPTCMSWKSSNLPIYSFPLELGFAITFHKVQGKTLEKIILALNKRKGRRLPNVTFTSFLVGVSRVRDSKNIRRLQAFDASSLSYLLDLKEDPSFKAWKRCYNVNGKFISSPMPKKRNLREVYEIIQGNDWSQLNASNRTIRRWKSEIIARGDIEQELENHGDMEFRSYMSKRFRK